MSEPKKVIVIGGSFAGLGVASNLLKQTTKRGISVKVLLINPSDSWYFNVASPRVIAKPDAFGQDKYLYSIPDLYTKYTSSNRFELQLGRAIAIHTESKRVSVLEKGSAIPVEIAYDYLVIASGSTTQSTLGNGSIKLPFKSTGDDLLTSIQDAQTVVKSAHSVIIGGAGPVGVEFAGELAEAFAAERKDGPITLISATDKVLPGIQVAGQDRAMQILRSLGVKTVTGAKVLHATKDSPSKQWTVRLSNGETRTADAYVSAVGVLPNNDFIPPQFLNDHGFVVVDDQFRLMTAASERAVIDGIYALGDITHHPFRLSSRIPAQVSAVVTNLIADISGTGPRATGYDPAKHLNALVVPIGRCQGTGQIASFTVPGFFVSFVKGRDYLTGSARGLVQ